MNKLLAVLAILVLTLGLAATEASRFVEDGDFWDCRTMGNQRCGAEVCCLVEVWK